jgi:hypothetical protein
MTTEKQQKTYVALMVVVVILLLGAQFGLQYMFRQASAELVSVTNSLAAENKTFQSRRSLSERYKAFQEKMLGQSGSDRQFPLSGIDLFAALNNIFRDYSIESVNKSTTTGTQPGQPFTLQIEFKGQYYNLIKALAAARESGILMRVSALSVEAQGDGNVKGTMSIISTSRAQG